MPTTRLAVRPENRPPKDPPRLRAGRDLPGPRRGRRRSSWRSTEMTDPRDRDPRPKQAEREAIKDINQDYKTKFGFNDPETGYVYKAPKGLSRQLVEDISEYKDEPQWMREFRLKALEHFLARPVPQWGAEPEPDRLRRHPLLRPRLRAGLSRAGTTSPRTSRTPSTSSASPRPSATSSPASAPSTSPRSSTTRSARTSRSRASSSSTWTPRCASTRTSSASTSRR